jgi:hypothetical protein
MSGLWDAAKRNVIHCPDCGAYLASPIAGWFGTLHCECGRKVQV